jgi:hypothetical protein
MTTHCLDASCSAVILCHLHIHVQTLEHCCCAVCTERSTGMSIARIAMFAGFVQRCLII